MIMAILGLVVVWRSQTLYPLNHAIQRVVPIRYKISVMMNIINDALCRIMTLYDAIMAISLREAANEAVARLGYDRGMKEEQLEITTKFLSGRDVFAILPTGFGKSLCYACLPLAFQLKGLATPD